MFLTWDALGTGNEGPVCQQSVVDNKSDLRVVMVPPQRRDTTLSVDGCANVVSDQMTVIYLLGFFSHRWHHLLRNYQMKQLVVWPFLRSVLM